MILVVCPFCDYVFAPIELRDELSIKEFLISGLCQDCQDDVFGAVDDAPVK